MSGARSLAGLVAFLLLGGVVLALGGVVTATSVGNWYQAIAKPAFNPPDWIFGPVWTALFLMMSIAAWRVWRQAGSLASCHSEMVLYGVQLALNLGWSAVFFGLRQIVWGMAEMVILFIAILWTAYRFWLRDRVAGWLFAPYVGWVGFALVLNGSIWFLN